MIPPGLLVAHALAHAASTHASRQPSKATQDWLLLQLFAAAAHAPPTAQFPHELQSPDASQAPPDPVDGPPEVTLPCPLVVELVTVVAVVGAPPGPDVGSTAPVVVVVASAPLVTALVLPP